jgi:hypothetical protein
MAIKGRTQLSIHITDEHHTYSTRLRKKQDYPTLKLWKCSLIHTLVPQKNY